MRALSQSDYGLIRSLYQDVYAPDIAESILDEFTDEDLDDLTDEYIEEQVIEFFEECLEEGLDIDIVEQTICESVDTELEVLSERVDPNEIQRRRNQAKLRLASPEKKASKLSQIKGVVKKVGSAAKSGLKTAGQAAKGASGLAGRSISTAKRAGSSLKTSFKKGYERGKGSPQTSSSSSSDSGSSSSSGTGPSSSSSSDSGSSSSSGTGPSSSSFSGGGSSSAAPTKRKDGLLKRGLKKVVRGITKGVSAAADAVKAGADSLTDRARKEDMNYNKELATIKELYRQVYAPKNLDEDFEFLDEFSDEEIDDIVEEVVLELLDEGYEVDEIEDLFEDTFLVEGRVDMESRAARRKEANAASERSAKIARKAGADVVKKEKKAVAKVAKKEKSEERREKIKSSAINALKTVRNFGRKAVEKGVRAANVGAEKVKRASAGEDRKKERNERKSKINAKNKMKNTAVANIRKAVTGSSRKEGRKDQTGSVGAGAKGTITTKTTVGGSSDGPSSKGRALGPKGTTSRTDTKVVNGKTQGGNLRKDSQIKFALAKAQRTGAKRLLNNSLDVFDVVIEFLCDYGIAEDLQEAQWLMVNEIDSEDIATILEAYGSPRPTKLPLSRERMTKKVDDWKEDPNRDFGKRGTAAKNLRSRANAVVGTQRRQDKEVGM